MFKQFAVDPLNISKVGKWAKYEKCAQHNHRSADSDTPDYFRRSLFVRNTFQKGEFPSFACRSLLGSWTLQPELWIRCCHNWTVPSSGVWTRKLRISMQLLQSFTLTKTVFASKCVNDERWMMNGRCFLGQLNTNCSELLPQGGTQQNDFRPI